jgi:glycosyltransferase involved in cell wall biosynthesis
MRLGAVGAVVYPPALDPCFGDPRTWHELSRHFEGIAVIGQTAGRRPRRARVARVSYLLLPKLPRALDLFFFPAAAFVVALAWRLRGVRTWTFSDPLRSGAVAVALRTFPGTRVVIQVQGQLLRLPGPRFGARKRLIEVVARWASRRAHAVRAVSEDVAREARAAGIPASRIEVIPSRCDVGYFHPDRWRTVGREVRDGLSVGGDRPVVGFLGALNASKGLDVLLASAGRLSAESGAVVAVAGAGPLTRAVDAAAEAAGGDLVGVGRLTGDDVPAFLSAVDVLVVPSHDEGLPRTLLEAMAMERAVVASAVGGIPEAVEDGRSGVLIPSGDATALADAVLSLLADEARRREMGRLARARVLERFEARENLRQFASLHHRLDARSASH